MKPATKLLIILMTVAAGSLASGAAMARGAHFGVWIGGPVWGPWYPPYYPYYYPPAPVVVSPPPVYIDNGSAAAVPAAPPQSGGNYWYYCRDAQGYYPYVKECPGGSWERVPAQPPR